MAVYLKRNDVPDNVWVGVTVENRQCASRLDILRGINARIKFVSFEPLLESVAGISLTGIDWAIVGGESGRNSRAMKEEWVLEIQDECERTGTAFFFKQWGGVNKYAEGSRLKGKEYKNFPCEDNVSVNDFELAIEEHLKQERQLEDIERQYYKEIINNTSR
jgi:protein gp37